MDKKTLEERIREHLDQEEGQWQAMEDKWLQIHNKLDKAQQAIDSLRVDLRDTRAEFERQKELVIPFAQFLQDMQAVSRAGRTLRALVGWLALFLGAGAMVYVALGGGVGKE